MNMVQVYGIFRISQMLGTFEVKFYGSWILMAEKSRAEKINLEYKVKNQVELLEVESLGMRKN